MMVNITTTCSYLDNNNSPGFFKKNPFYLEKFFASAMMPSMSSLIKKRFRGFLPVVVDVETAGFNAHKDALLEVAAINIIMNKEGLIEEETTWHEHILPFKGANLDEDALAFNQIKPFHPFRFALEESVAMEKLAEFVKIKLSETGCQKAILVGHNASFDHSFLLAACQRHNIKFMFHSFSTFDTATLSALALGETVLAKALQVSKIGYDASAAHSALYDVEQTAKLFCHIVNHTKYKV
ncbi:MAG: ribonuclease T [Pseudomonadota bacterium]|nr:ribonuclease T [Pseudomonadota bacterium]